MSPVPLNYLAIVVAAAASMIIGMLWYGPFFGKQWIALSGMAPEAMAAAKAKGMGIKYAFALLGSLATSYVLAHAVLVVTYLFYLAEISPAETGITSGLITGFASWLGFIAPVTLGAVLWEGRPWKLWFLNAGYWLVSLLAMGMILALWP